MADAKRGKDGRLGPYRLGREHGRKDSGLEDLGQARRALLGLSWQGPLFPREP